MKKRIAYLGITIGLLTVIFFCFSTTAYSQSVEKAAFAEKERMDLQEKEFLHRIKQVMEAYGCLDSGVTMTKTYTQDGDRIYRVIVHHRNLSYLSDGEREELRDLLEEQMKRQTEQQSVSQTGQKSQTGAHTEFHFELTYSL